MEKVVVQPSPIHGRGVFAARRIEPAEVIIDGCRELLSDEAIQSLPPEEKIFLSVIDGQHILMKPPARFVNHSVIRTPAALTGTMSPFASLKPAKR